MHTTPTKIKLNFKVEMYKIAYTMSYSAILGLFKIDSAEGFSRRSRAIALPRTITDSNVHCSYSWRWCERIRTSDLPVRSKQGKGKRVSISFHRFGQCTPPNLPQGEGHNIVKSDWIASIKRILVFKGEENLPPLDASEDRLGPLMDVIRLERGG